MHISTRHISPSRSNLQNWDGVLLIRVARSVLIVAHSERRIGAIAEID